MRVLASIGACLLLAPAVQDGRDLRPGLLGEYFDIGERFNDFPNLKDLKPTLRRIDPRIDVLQTNGNFAESGLVDCFYVRWTGILRVPKSGRYRFYTDSDDGSRVLIGGKLVVDNGGLHVPEQRDGEVTLAEGDHALQVDYFEDVGGASCTLRWASDDIRMEVVPARVLFHRFDPDLDE